MKCGLVTLHKQDDILRHHVIMHASRLETFSKVTEESPREVAGGVALMQIGAVKGKGKKRAMVKASSCKLRRRER